MFKESLSHLDDCLLKSSNIVVCVHKSPDVDAVGSLVAFKHFFDNHYAKLFNFNISLLIPDKIPQHLLWLVKDCSDQTITIEDFEARGKDAFEKSDVIICLDLNQTSRIGIYEQLFKNSKALKINIDHHPQKTDEFDLVIRNCQASSCAEIIYDIFSEIDDQAIDNKTVEAIYAGMLGDTGSFSYSCDNPHTYVVLSKLAERGIDVRNVHDLVFNNYPLERTYLLGYVLYNKIQVIKVKDELVTYYSLTCKEMDEQGYQEGYLEGVINFALNNQGVRIAVSFVERNNSIRISFRSKAPICINSFAEKYFNGGGHPNASGATVTDKTLEECVEIFKNHVNECFI